MHGLCVRCATLITGKKLNYKKTAQERHLDVREMIYSQYSVVGIATHYGLGGLGIKFRDRRDFPHPSTPTLWPNQPPVQWVPGFLP